MRSGFRYTLKKVVKMYESLNTSRTKAVNVLNPPWKTAEPMVTKPSLARSAK